MEKPLINILIRTSKRKELFFRCTRSILSQSYTNYRIIVSCDSSQSFKYVFFSNMIDNIVSTAPQLQLDHYWNLYCNELKSQVNEGWFFYLDDDDYLYDNNSLERIAQHLTNPNEGVICQFIRNGKPKPNNQLIEQKRIEKGRIGSPSLFLHSSQKDIANWDGHRAADYRFIRDVAAKLPMKFVPVVVVQTGNNGLHGK